MAATAFPEPRGQAPVPSDCVSDAQRKTVTETEPGRRSNNKAEAELPLDSRSETPKVARPLSANVSPVIIYALGSNGKGQLGIGHDRDVSHPREVLFVDGCDPPESIVSICAGGNHTLLLSSDGSVYSSGDASTGACGNSYETRPEDRFKFQKVEFAQKGKIRFIAATWQASIVVQEGDNRRATNVLTFGTGVKGELGLGKFINKTVTAQLIRGFPQVLRDDSSTTGESSTTDEPIMTDASESDDHEVDAEAPITGGQGKKSYRDAIRRSNKPNAFDHENLQCSVDQAVAGDQRDATEHLQHEMLNLGVNITAQHEKLNRLVEDATTQFRVDIADDGRGRFEMEQAVAHVTMVQALFEAAVREGFKGFPAVGIRPIMAHIEEQMQLQHLITKRLFENRPFEDEMCELQYKKLMVRSAEFMQSILAKDQRDTSATEKLRRLFHSDDPPRKALGARMPETLAEMVEPTHFPRGWEPAARTEEVVEVVSLSASMAHVVVTLSDGSTWGWGAARAGQLGPVTGEMLDEPHQITGCGRLNSKKNSAIAQAVCGKDFTYVARHPGDGEHFCLGSNRSGLRGASDTKGNSKGDPSYPAPNSVAGWKQIGAGWGSIYVLKFGGQLLSWGRNDLGQLAPKTLPPLLTHIAVGSAHALAMDADGVHAWGWGEHGNCGLHHKKGKHNTIVYKKDLPKGQKIVYIGAGCATSWICMKGDEPIASSVSPQSQEIANSTNPSAEQLVPRQPGSPPPETSGGMTFEGKMPPPLYDPQLRYRQLSYRELMAEVATDTQPPVDIYAQFCGYPQRRGVTTKMEKLWNDVQLRASMDSTYSALGKTETVDEASASLLNRSTMTKQDHSQTSEQSRGRTNSQGLVAAVLNSSIDPDSPGSLTDIESVTESQKELQAKDFSRAMNEASHK